MQQPIEQVLALAGRAGKIMLESGGESYRVETLVRYMCRAYGVKDYRCSATPTNIVITLIDNNGTAHTIMERIGSREMNLHKMEAVNDFSQKVSRSPVSVEEAMARLDVIEASKTYPLSVVLLAAGVGSAAFGFIFGGGLWEVATCFTVGIIIRLVILFLRRKAVSDVFPNFICGMCASLLCWVATLITPATLWHTMTLGSLTLLFPGQVLTNAMRDIAAGDFISGTSNAAEAMIVAAALAGGVGAMYLMLRYFLGVVV